MPAISTSKDYIMLIYSLNICYALLATLEAMLIQLKGSLTMASGSVSQRSAWDDLYLRPNVHLEIQFMVVLTKMAHRLIRTGTIRWCVLGAGMALLEEVCHRGVGFEL